MIKAAEDTRIWTLQAGQKTTYELTPALESGQVHVSAVLLPGTVLKKRMTGRLSRFSGEEKNPETGERP